MTNENTDQIVKLMQTDDSVDAPHDSIKWAKGLFRTRVFARPTLVERIFAVLQMDIKVDDPLLGERSAATAKIRQVLYTAGNIAIDLRITCEKTVVSVRGQILGDGLSGATITLLNDTDRYETQLDENSEFALRNVKPGSYALTVEAAGTIIELDTIDLP